MSFSADEELDKKALLAAIADRPIGELGTELVVGDEVETYTLTLADTTIQPSFALSGIRHIALLRPTNDDELSRAHGIGPAKLERYGPGLLAIVNGP